MRAFIVWRRGRDSNPGTPVKMLLEFQSSAFDHSATSPNRNLSALVEHHANLSAGAGPPARDSALPCAPPRRGRLPSLARQSFKFAPSELSRPLGHLSKSKLSALVEHHANLSAGAGPPARYSALPCAPPRRGRLQSLPRQPFTFAPCELSRPLGHLSNLV